MIVYSDSLIFQRVLPHYRVALFQALYERYGVRVVTSAKGPANSFLNLADPRDQKWAIPVDFVYPDPKSPERAIIPIRDILDEFKPRAIVAEFGLRISSSYVLPRMRLTGRLKRLVFWSHGWQMGRATHGIRNRFVQYSRLPFFAAADTLATYSEEGAEWIRHHMPWKQVISLGNTLDIESLRRIGKSAEAVRFGSPQLLCVGRLTQDKRFDLAIEVVRLLRPKFPNISLSIVGDGPELPRLSSLVDEELAPHIRFFGAIYGEEKVASHFLGADLFVVTGAAGLSVNHALAYGVPVVAFERSRFGPYHHPEIEYLVPGLSGILIKHSSLKALSEGIEAALHSGELARIRRAVPAFVDQSLMLDGMVEKFGYLLRSLR